MLNNFIKYVFGFLISGFINFVMCLPVPLFVLYVVSEFKKSTDEKWMKINKTIKRIVKVTLAFLFCFSFILKIAFRKK